MFFLKKMWEGLLMFIYFLRFFKSIIFIYQEVNSSSLKHDSSSIKIHFNGRVELLRYPTAIAFQHY